MSERSDRISERRGELLSRIELDIVKRSTRLEEQIINQVLEALFTTAEFSGGKISNRTNLTKVIRKINQIFRGLEGAGKTNILKAVEEFEKVSNANRSYFVELTREPSDKIDDLIIKSNNNLDNTLGIERYKNGNVKDLVAGSLLSEKALNNLIKQNIQRIITQSAMIEQTIGRVKARIKDTTEKQIVKDLQFLPYQSSRQQSNDLSKDLQIDTYYAYNGTPVTDSRHFCEGGFDDISGFSWKKKKGMIFHIDEINSWKNYDWQGKPKVGYDPFSNLGPGGFNCRDSLDAVIKNSAFRLRPILRDYQQNPENFTIVNGVLTKAA